MQIVRHSYRGDAKEAPQMFQRFPEELHGFDDLQIADVLAKDGVPVLGEAERVLQLAAAGKHFGQRRGERDRVRRLTARPPHRLTRADIAIVQQKSVRAFMQRLGKGIP
jgi:hypothetical protein